jgi:hypothetical protein
VITDGTKPLTDERVAQLVNDVEEHGTWVVGTWDAREIAALLSEVSSSRAQRDPGHAMSVKCGSCGGRIALLLGDHECAASPLPAPATTTPPSAYATVGAEIVAEIERARRKHAPMRGPHEGYAVLLEEVDELWDEVKRRDPDLAAMRKEAIQIAAMGLAFAVEACAPAPATPAPGSEAREGHVCVLHGPGCPAMAAVVAAAKRGAATGSGAAEDPDPGIDGKQLREEVLSVAETLRSRGGVRAAYDVEHIVWLVCGGEKPKEPPKEPWSAPRCPNCENGSGYVRRVGRDNDEIVEDCPDHRAPAPLPASGEAAICTGTPTRSDVCDDTSCPKHAPGGRETAPAREEPDCYGQRDACMRPGCPCCDPNAPEDKVRIWMMKHGMPGAILWKRGAASRSPGSDPEPSNERK